MSRLPHGHQVPVFAFASQRRSLDMAYYETEGDDFIFIRKYP
jgi:hypothetical protein